MFPQQSKLSLSMLYLWTVHVLCGKTNWVVWTWRLRLPGNNLMSPEPPLPQQEGLCPNATSCEANRCRWQALQATGALNSCHPTSDCPMPKQTSRPSWQGHCHAYSLEGKATEWGWGTWVLLESRSTVAPAASPRAPIHTRLRSDTVRQFNFCSSVPACPDSHRCLRKLFKGHRFNKSNLYFLPNSWHQGKSSRRTQYIIIKKSMHFEICGLNGKKISWLISWFWWCSFCTGRRTSSFVGIPN